MRHFLPMVGTMIVLTCEICRENFRAKSGSGRPPKFCSSECREAAGLAWKEAHKHDGPATRRVTCAACVRPNGTLLAGSTSVETSVVAI